MHLVVIGGGSVGLLLAGRLQLCGQTVALLTRGEEQAARLQREQLTIHTLSGECLQAPVSACAFSDPLPAADCYLLAVKQPFLPDLLPALAKLPDSARVVALQNGMGHEELLRSVIPAERLFFAVNTEGAKRLSPVEVAHTGRGRLRLGPWRKQASRDPLIADLVKLLSECSIDAEYVDEASGLLWRKLLANACINPLTALFEVHNGMLVQSPLLTSLMRQLFREAAEVANAAGQKITEKDWQEIVTICRNTFRNDSSMLQDLRHGRPTEIESISGYIAGKGKENGIPTPLHETLRRAVLLKQTVHRGGASNGDSG
ncbi:ketopantoate reductase family protein [Brevibacillus massiliensis]|jgi:2-dehydropantoate 2-reductase|uniref:ketopantoate reductase family protein n=1 Tax=Brevibacillus massiliensis TaxID=1118054 RepID=UPI0002E1599D|nr:2-dehydropantoate 2-reductase [Brevibacillus massiliensis]